MIKAAVFGGLFTVLFLILNFGFLAALFLTFSTYLVTGGWRFCRLCYYTLPRDARALYTVIRFKLLAKKYKKERKGIQDCFKENVKKHPDKLAFIEVDGKEWTFREVDEYSNQIGNILYNQGFRHGDTIGLFMNNRPEYVCIWLGMVKIGATPALLNFNLRSKSLAHCINIVDCKGILFDSEIGNAVTEIKNELKNSTIFCAWGTDFDATKNDKVMHIDAELSKASKFSPPREFLTDFNGKLMYIYTSGTTGLPKAAVVIHSRFFYMSFVLSILFRLPKDTILYDTLPLYHTAGGILGVGQALVNGSTTVIRKKFSASRFWDDCLKYNCNAVQYIGEICRYLLATPNRPSEKQHRVNVAFGNGLRPQIWSEFMERFNIERIGEFYGATEGNANLANVDNKHGAIGFVSLIEPSFYPVTLIRVDDYTGKAIRDREGLCVKCKPGERGELVGKIVKTDPLRNFDGYANKEATEKKIVRDVFKKGDSAFLTGDVLEMDEFGYLYFKDRTGDTFRWKGENVSTAEVEASISNIVKLSDAVAYGVELPGQEGRAGMVAIVADENQLDLEKLYNDLQTSLPPYARPLFVRFLKNAETTGTFKLKKTDYRNEGIDIEKIKDPVYYLEPREKKYKLLDFGKYQDILNGQIRY